jgi:hypothetical protein
MRVCTTCDCMTKDIMMDLLNPTFETYEYDGEFAGGHGKLPERYCRDCFGKLPGHSIEEFDRAMARAMSEPEASTPVHEFCDFPTGDFNSVVDCIEHYNADGVLIAVSTG